MIGSSPTPVRRVWRPAVMGTVVAAVLLAGAAGAAGAPYGISAPTLVTGPSPFTGCAIGAAGPSSVLFPNAEVEPMVALNPRNAANLIGPFQQDRWSDGGARGLVAGRSVNGGATWTESFAAFSACSGGDPAYERSSDPWVAFDTAGNAHQISLSISADQVTSAVLVSKSTDQGATWGAPTTLIRDDNPINFNDKESITGDPTRPGHVYATWDRGALPGENRSFNSVFHSSAFRGQPVFSRTTDGGAHWSPVVAMTAQNVFTIGNQIAVLPDGTLVDVFWAGKGSGRQPSPNQTFEGVMTSNDAGLHWTPLNPITNFVPVPGCGVEDVCDPDNNRPVRAGTNLPDIAVDGRTGAIYVVWADGRFSGGTHVDVVLSKSTDGGKSWSTPVKVNQRSGGAQAFTPAVEVASDGTVAVSFYDFRNNTAAPGLPTDAWLAHSHDGGATWTEQHLGGPFDMEAAPFARGFFVGDYEGLTSIGRDLLAYFVMTNAGTPANPTDVFAVRATAP